MTPDGETTVIVGHSGAGKSVALKLIVGLLEPDHGSVEVDGQVVHALDRDRRSRDLLGQFLFSYKLNPQTALLLGYSDNQLGSRGIDLTRTDRTFFLKASYAWVP